MFERHQPTGRYRPLLTVRSPLRLSLAGGGTDLPEYCERFGGYFISAALDYHVRLELHARPRSTFAKAGELLRAVGLPSNLGLAIHSDIQGGTGLGSSGALAAAAVIAAEHRSKGSVSEPGTLALHAYRIERSVLSPNAGHQDTLVSLFGGIREYRIDADGASATPLPLSADAAAELASRLLLVDTGVRRAADTLLADQEDRVRDGDDAMLMALHKVKARAWTARTLLCGGDFDEYAAHLHEHWMTKRVRSHGMTNPDIDALYEIGRAAGALGGKLVGAGGGGFLLMYSTSTAALASRYRETGVVSLPVRFASSGAVVTEEGQR